MMLCDGLYNKIDVNLVIFQTSNHKLQLIKDNNKTVSHVINNKCLITLKNNILFFFFEKAMFFQCTVFRI